MLHYFMLSELEALATALRKEQYWIIEHEIGLKFTNDNVKNQKFSRGRNHGPPLQMEAGEEASNAGRGERMEKVKGGGRGREGTYRLAQSVRHVFPQTPNPGDATVHAGSTPHSSYLASFNRHSRTIVFDTEEANVLLKDFH